MALPTTQTELEEWCLRQLGKPVIKINVSASQVSDAMDEALQFWQEYSEAGQERTYIAIQLTAPMLASRAVPLPANVQSVVKLVDWNSFGGSISGADPLFSFDYHMGSEMVWGILQGNGGMSSYAITRQYMAEMDALLSPDPSFRFRHHNGLLHIDSKVSLAVGQYVVVECYATLDPALNPKIWSDRYFRRLATGYLKKTWGSNLSKYESITLPSGITMNGTQLYTQAIEEVAQAESEIRLHMEPLGIIIA